MLSAFTDWLGATREGRPVPSFSLASALAAAATWLAVGLYAAWEMSDDDAWDTRALVAGCVILAGSGAAAHAGLLSFHRFRALAAKGRITAVWVVTLGVFLVVRIVRGAVGSAGSPVSRIVNDAAIALVPALAMAALASYAVERLENRASRAGDARGPQKAKRPGSKRARHDRDRRS